MGALLVVDFRLRTLLNTPPQAPRSRDFYEDPRTEPNEDDLFAFYDHRIEGIRARYGDNPPSQGVVYKQRFTKKGFDTYGWGCVHNSIHQYQRKEGELWNQPFPMPADLRAIDKHLKKSRGKVLEVGLKSDPFMWMDNKYCITKAVIKLATQYGVRLVFYTMSDLCASNDYAELLRDGEHTVVFHMGFSELLMVDTSKLDRLTCPGAPSRLRRQKAKTSLREFGVEIGTDVTYVDEILKDKARLAKLTKATGCAFINAKQMAEFCNQKGGY